MMSNRNRPMTPRKSRLWVSSQVTLPLTGTGPGGQVGVPQLGVDFKTKVDRNFVKTDTLAHVWARGTWSGNITGTATVFPMMFFGIGFYATLSDNADFPDLALHSGDWQTHDARALREALVANEPYLPTELSAVDIESSGQRSAPGNTGFELFTVAQSTATGGGTQTLRLAVTALWLTAS